MTSHKTDDQSKTPENSKISGKEELTSSDLDKVVGGLKKNIGGPKSGIVADPCAGGE
jgi:hypothetical protein